MTHLTNDEWLLDQLVKLVNKVTSNCLVVPVHSICCTRKQLKLLTINTLFFCWMCPWFDNTFQYFFLPSQQTFLIEKPRLRSQSYLHEEEIKNHFEDPIDDRADTGCQKWHFSEFGTLKRKIRFVLFNEWIAENSWRLSGHFVYLVSWKS